ncbi:ABC transporter ATP-binding protein [Dactylosporangium vinaceum]|uniref:ATP-binding cassette domain-containing protein n=1 Tax=Dactylosporangium vinaceum TaxID=53362 RepID=A0ABV5MCZ1_9ACTN|nr:ABC transporter ATP-binding protein [Dactylosporangium vinaceum]UAC00775.1 ABC transporter ATP-binding protein [Dactylosporangium vinaceum]
MNAVETFGLTQRYRRTVALDDCTLAIPAGRVVALVGPNGAGKTTLLELAIGLRRPTSGRIEALGAEPGARRDRIGFLDQHAALYPALTIRELLRLGEHLNTRWDAAVAWGRIEALGLSPQRRFGTLSGGQQSQVALALALGKRPDLLLLDEPLARLDPLARHEFLAALLSVVAEREVSVLFSSHNLAELERACDYLVLLQEGVVRLAGDVDDLVAHHELLTGRPDRSGGLGAHTVVSRVGTTAQEHVLVRTHTPRSEPPPGWQRRPVTLDELVLAYLRSDAAARPGPRAVVTG